MAVSISHSQTKSSKTKQFQLQFLQQKIPKLTKIWQKLLCKFTFILVALRAATKSTGKAAEHKKYQSEAATQDVAGSSNIC